MSCEELSDSYELYALGVLDEPEKAGLEEHLGRECPTCMAGLKRARATTTMLGAVLTDEAEPSRRLRPRILAIAGLAPARPWGWIGAFAAAAAALVLGIFYFRGAQDAWQRQIAQVRTQLEARGLENARLQQALDFLNTPETKLVGFGTGQPAPPKGNFFVNPRGVLLIASNLPALAPGRTYQMWLIPKGGAPRPAGLFQADPRGGAVHILAGAVDVAATGAMAISVEPAGGSAQPTTQPIVVAPVAGL